MTRPGWLPLLLLPPLLAGCAFFKSLAGRNTVDLEGAEVKSMGVDIRKEEKTLCPRERVQLAVFMEAKLAGEEGFASYETWSGRESRNGRLDFDAFAFDASTGSVDQEGFLDLPHDLLRTISDEVVIRTVYRARPEAFSFTTRYKPDYRCIEQGGRSGRPGSSGAPGAAGERGATGESGDDTRAGGPGGQGSAGTAGGHGEAGEAGPSLRVVATRVQTAFYDDLIAVKIEGDVQDLLLLHPEQVVTLLARGGDGGAGGPGGDGGDGGNGGVGNPGGAGGSSGPGGPGGDGGPGGAGGTVELVLDPSFPDLAAHVAVVVDGGRGGAAGFGGQAGRAGFGGSGRGTGAATGASGSRGASGPAGNSGLDGVPGVLREQPGDPRPSFEGLSGLTVKEAS